MGEYNDEYYYQKYLKYKNKYLELKEYEGGGMLPETGIYAYFCNKADADKICEAIYKKTTTSYNINKILSDDKNFIAYKGKQGDTKLTRIRQYNRVKAANATSAAANFAGKSASAAASKAGQSASAAASKVGQSASAAASKAGQSMASFGTSAMRLGSNFTSGVADRATAVGKELRTSASNRATAALKTITPKQDNVFIGGGLPVVFNLFDKNDKTNKTKKVLNHTDIGYLLDIVKFLRAQPDAPDALGAHKKIDSVVIITYSPMGKNICTIIPVLQATTVLDEEAKGVVLGKNVATKGMALLAKARANVAARNKPLLLEGPNEDIESEGGEEADGVEAGNINVASPVSPGKSSPLRRSATAHF